MLTYENEAILELMNESCLLISSRGLGIHRIFCAFLKLYAADSKCYFVLNTTSAEQNFLIEELRTLERNGEQPTHPEPERPGAGTSNAASVQSDSLIAPKIITSEVQHVRRVELYKTGGIVFVSSRILLVDLLLNRVPASAVGGALIWNAHRIIETAHESLICSVLAHLNSSASLRAFSDSPTRFGFAYGPLRIERAMRNVHAKRLVLLPRFHASVASVFDVSQRRNLVLTELHASASDAFRTLEMTLSTILRSLLSAFREASTRQRLGAYLPNSDIPESAGSSVSNENAFEISYENCVLMDTASFERMLRCAVEPAWHALGERARRLIAEVRTIQSFFSRLITLDAISFHRALLAVSTAQPNAAVEVEQNADWLVLDESSRLIEIARRRVFGTGTAAGETGHFDARKCEPNPKWCALLQCLTELRTDVSPSQTSTPIIIVCESRYLVRQLRGLLRYGTIQLLERIWRHNDTDLHGASNADPNDADTELHIVPSTFSFELCTTDTEPDRLASLADEINLLTAIHERFSFVFIATSDPAFEPRFVRSLESTQPRYVILYDADIRAIRQLEVYVAVRDSQAHALPHEAIKVYFLQLKDSLEEQRYLNILRQEKTAFESLIREQGSLILAYSQLADPFAPPNDFLDAELDVDSESPWIGDRRPRAVVDMREFRSELPCVLFVRGFQVVPKTLQIGDYLLTVAGSTSDVPLLCIERKSLPDLSQSLVSGRLYAQCVQMCRAYDRPILLIEFDLQSGFAPFVRRAESPFGGGETGSGPGSGTSSSFYDMQSKLTLLVLRFPKLRITWSPNPYCTSELFNEMLIAAMRNRLFMPRKNLALAGTSAATGPSTSTGATASNANADQVINADTDDVTDLAMGADQYRFRPADLLLKLPGVTHKNVSLLVRSFSSLRAIANASYEQLNASLNNREEARRLHAFFHKSVIAASSSNSDPSTNAQNVSNNRQMDAPKRPRAPALHLAALVREKRTKTNAKEPTNTG